MSEIEKLIEEGKKAAKSPVISADQEVFSTIEAAVFLRTKPQTMDKWRLTKGGGPPFSRIGNGRGKILYRKSALIKWLEENEMRAA
jgi:hypothetical protein